jgi:superfamily II DNA or RNA helicase
LVNQTIKEKLILFRSLFKGREDVFAIHWEKMKSGYMPAYFYDPYRYRAHKMKGGTFQTYADKTYLPLSDDQLLKHLNGEQLIGVYPLLQDNTTWFIAADFDGQTWSTDSKKFIDSCKAKNIPSYLERSRSGKGAHVWIFFTQTYPAFKSRKIVLSMLTQSDIISTFDKNSSFDRLFPNQDTLSGKGLGNLIALPLHNPSMEQGNSCFIDPDNLHPFPDQWNFLSGIQKVSTEHLENVFGDICHNQSQKILSSKKEDNNTLTIALSNIIRLNRSAIPLLLVNFLREELNFANTEFIINKNSGKNTFGVERYFRFVTESGTDVILPRGFAGKLFRFCRDNSIPFEFKDLREKRQTVLFSFSTQLRPYQNPATEAAAKKDMGIIVAPPGSGKTVIGLKIISDRQQPSLIVVHRKALMEQWIERISAFLGIPKHEIGRIGQGKTTIGKRITVATIQSLAKQMEKPDNSKLRTSFGTVLIDECHHMPAQTYRNTIQQLNSYYLYGLTATPFRKYTDGKLIFIHLGEIIAEITARQTRSQQASIIIRETALDVPFNSKTDRFETLSKVLVHDSARNRQILHDVIQELDSGKKVVILTERKEHIDALQQYLKQSYEVITLSGEDVDSSRAAKWRLLKDGNYQALITTGQFFGEGTDLQNASCLFLVYPFSFEGKLVQYMGRVQRSEVTPSIYDYRDIKIDYLNKLFLKRNTYYRKLIRHATLFDDPIEESLLAPKNRFGKEKDAIIIDKEITVPIESLEFRYGGISFIYSADIGMNIEFEIQHDDFRPEFEVLKPYFIKALRSKNIKASVYAEMEEGRLMAQLATSEDTKKINREVIEGVRFQFVTKPLFGRTASNVDENSEDKHRLQSDHPLYQSSDELLQDILQHTQFKHHRHLRYLADKHAGHLLKVRFILQPFSFVFLLEGQEQFHIILETLDTEEATYLWHVEKDIADLQLHLKEIDRHLDIIRKQGRQGFLITPPNNFSRVLHDYSNEQKGFIIWKDLLEERLA